MGHGTSWMDQVFPSQHKMQRTASPGDPPGEVFAAPRAAPALTPMEQLREMQAINGRQEAYIRQLKSQLPKPNTTDYDDKDQSGLWIFGCCYSSFGLGLRYFWDKPDELWKFENLVCDVLWPIKMCSYCIGVKQSGDMTIEWNTRECHDFMGWGLFNCYYLLPYRKA
jgi:hypothetical protein